MTGSASAEASPRPALFVAWTAHSTRSEGLARALGAELVSSPWSHPRQPKLVKIAGWVRSAFLTLRCVRRVPPGGLVVVMAPPVFAPLVSRLFRRRGVAFAIDMHSGALDDPKWRWSFPLMRRLLQRSDAVIVTTPEALRGLPCPRTEVVTIVDPTLATNGPQPQGSGQRASRPTNPDREYVLFPASGEIDEPVDAVAEAAAVLAGEVDVVVTGRQPARLASTALKLTGFVSKGEYRELIEGAGLVLALTTREATNQRAACEALQSMRPLVCSATRMLQETYRGAAVFAAPDRDAIAAAIREGLARREELRSGIPAVVNRLRSQASAGVERLLALRAR